MLTRASRSLRASGGLRRSYATRPDIPILPPNQARKSLTDGDAIPPMMPPDMAPVGPSEQVGPNVNPPLSVKTDDAIPFGTGPVLINDEPVIPKRTHKFRNTLLTLLIGGGLLFGGGVYGSLQNDTVYEIFTEFVPYGEEAVLYLQEQEFRRRYPQAHAHVTKQALKHDTPSISVPQAGAVARVRDEPARNTEAKILQKGPQNSALKEADKATPGGSNYVPSTNKRDASEQAGSQTPATEGLDKTGKLPESGAEPSRASIRKAAVQGSETKQEPASAATPVTKSIVEPVPPPSAPIKTFDIPKANDKSIERLQFAINGVIKAANEYGSSPFFKAALDNAKDEVLALNSQIAQVQAQEQLKAETKLNAQAQEYGRMQQQQIAEINSQIADYERDMTIQIERERQRLNQAYSERLAEEVKRIESISEQRLQNELLEQAIALQKKLNREVKSRVEEERSGRLGKLEGLQKSIAELKQLNVDSSSFIEERTKLQDLEVALNALKNVLHEPTPRPFIKELAAVKEIGGSDELLRATIESIDRTSYEAGVPTLGQLADRFRSVAEEVRKTSLLPEGAGVAGHATSWLLSKVMFRKRGMVPGSDVEAVLARTEAHLEANDLDSATREMNSLTGWAHIISADWLRMARRYLELQQSVDLLENSIILQALRTQ